MLPERQWRAEPLLGLALGVVAAFCASVLVFQGAESFFPGGTKDQPGVWSQFAATLVFHAMILAAVHGFLRWHQSGWVEVFGLNAPRKARTIRLTLLFSVAILPIALSLAKLSEMALQTAGFPADTQASVRSLQATQTFAQRACFAFTALIMAPFAEELLFRGILYPVLKRLGRPTLALWGGAFIFALIHSNLPTLLPLTVLAVGLTLLYETTGNLLAPILAHAFFNTANFIWLIKDLPK